jgi:hypothetical protein
MRLLSTAIASLLIGAAPAHGQDGPLTLANGRVTIGADVSASMTPNDDADGAWFNYTDYEHNSLRLLRLGVSADVRIAERVSVLSEIRSENGRGIEPYALYVRVRPWRRRPLDIQAGRIPLTFGAFSRRDYAAGNPLIGYPLAYQYLTSLRPDSVPDAVDDLLNMRARGWRPSYPIGSLSEGPGLPLITAFRWDTGVQARWGAERAALSVAITNGTVSDPRTRDNNSGKQVSSRVHWRPVTGLMLGASAARGPFVSNAISLPARFGNRSSRQRALGIDVEYSRGHWLVRGEAIWNDWRVPTLSVSTNASSGFVEGTYKIFPGVFVAGRIDRLTFSQVQSATLLTAWDAPVTRLEAGAGYYIRRNLIVKGAYQHNWRDGGLVRRLGLLAAQLQFWL